MLVSVFQSEIETGQRAVECLLALFDNLSLPPFLALMERIDIEGQICTGIRDYNGVIRKLRRNTLHWPNCLARAKLGRHYYHVSSQGLTTLHLKLCRPIDKPSYPFSQSIPLNDPTTCRK